MLDIEIVEPPTGSALDIVSVADIVRHLRLSPTMAANATWVGNITDAIIDVVADLEGIGGKLNRCIRPCMLKRYLTGFPCAGQSISLPYPPLISVEGITIEDGASVPNLVDPASYFAETTYIGKISAKTAWPSLQSGPRAMSVTYRAGYLDGVYPGNLKRLIKILVGHYLENLEATILEARQMAINRQVDYGVEYLMSTLKIQNSQDDWI